MKQNIQIGESEYKFVCEFEYEFVCEFDGMFYSEIVKDINELGIQICDLNYGQVRRYSLEKLKEWKDLKNLNASKAFIPKSK